MLIIPVCTLHRSRTALGIPIRGRHRQGISVAGANRILKTQVGNMAGQPLSPPAQECPTGYALARVTVSLQSEHRTQGLTR